MAIELRVGDYFLGAWTLHSPERNWMAVIVKRDGRWLIQYRFRYFKDNKIGEDSADKRNFYAASCEGTAPEDELIKNIRAILTSLKMAGFGSLEESVLMRTADMDKALELMNSLPSVSSHEMQNAGNENPGAN